MGGREDAQALGHSPGRVFGDDPCAGAYHPPSMGEMWQFVDFPFPDDRFPSQLAAVIQRTVLEGQLPARYVAHTDDNSWIVGDSINDPNDEGAAVAAHIRHVADRDPSLE